MCFFGHSEGIAGLHLGRHTLRQYSFQVDKIFFFTLLDAGVQRLMGVPILIASQDKDVTTEKTTRYVQHVAIGKSFNFLSRCSQQGTMLCNALINRDEDDSFEWSGSSMFAMRIGAW